MRVLVTGGAGFIGSHLCAALVRDGHQVVAADNLSTGKEENVPQGAALAQVDVTTPEIERLIADFAPGAVFHLAAQADVRRSVADPVFDAEANVLGTARVAAAAVRAAAGVIVLSSSGGAVYGEQRDFPADESHATKPVSPYGLSKLCAELYLGMFSRTAGVRAVALRYANVYGPRQDPHGEAGVVAIFCGRLLAGEPLVVYGDGRQTRDFVYVDDVVHANLRALAVPLAKGSYNVGTGHETDVLTLARLLGGAGASLRHEAERAGEQRRSVIDCRRAAIELDWRPSVPLAEGLARTMAYFRERAGRR